jgi:Secretion system C-terminal sorting domain
MKRLIIFILLLLPVFSYGQMKVYTVAGSFTATSLGDGGPATNAQIGSDEGIWMDGNCNLYISDLGGRRIRKVTQATGIITTIAGTGVNGFSGDNGPATDAKLTCYGLYSDDIGNVYFADPSSNRIRKVDAITGIITTIAGGGVTVGDNGPATNSKLDIPANVYGDDDGNIYIGENARIRKINKTGVITTIAGTGTMGLSGDGGLATNAQLYVAQGMLLDDHGNFYFADRGNHRIRKIDSKGIITTYAGTTDGYSGDGGPATAAQLSGPISFVIDYSGGMVIGDNQNNYLRRVDAQTGTITTIAGVGSATTGSFVNGALATTADIHPEFMYLDRSGNIFFSNYSNLVRKVTNYLPGLASISNGCGETAVPIITASDEVKLYPNPVTDVLHINTANGIYQTLTITNSIGQVMLQQNITTTETAVAVSKLPAGMYYISLRGSAGAVVSRFVKE